MGYVYHVSMTVMRVMQRPGISEDKIRHPLVMECTDEAAARSAYERLIKSLPGDTEDVTPIQFWPADERNVEVYYGDHTKAIEVDEHTIDYYQATINRTIALPWPNMRLWRNKRSNQPISGYVLMMNARHDDGLYYAKRVKVYGDDAYDRVVRLFISSMRSTSRLSTRCTTTRLDFRLRRTRLARSDDGFLLPVLCTGSLGTEVRRSGMMDWAQVICIAAPFICGLAVVLMEVADPWNNT
jgi:hypothetical protein